jgi:NAD+ kinase
VTKVALLLHRERPDAFATAQEVAAALEADGVEVCLPPDDAAAAGLPQYVTSEDRLFDAGLDLVVAIGGDGTMLRAAHLVGGDAPILGVNVGNLGYLTEVERPEAVDAVRRVLSGEHGIAERMVLSGQTDDGTEFRALNEIVVEKSSLGHTVRVQVTFDGDVFTTYEADGLIVATPTGSTAYNLSARGPIVDPDLRAVILTPVSPHMLFDRSMVIRPEVVVRLELVGHRPAALSADGGRISELQPGQAVECSGRDTVRFVTLRPRNFHNILRTKFQLPDR